MHLEHQGLEVPRAQVQKHLNHPDSFRSRNNAQIFLIFHINRSEAIHMVDKKDEKHATAHYECMVCAYWQDLLN